MRNKRARLNVHHQIWFFLFCWSPEILFAATASEVPRFWKVLCQIDICSKLQTDEVFNVFRATVATSLAS